MLQETILLLFFYLLMSCLEKPHWHFCHHCVANTSTHLWGTDPLASRNLSSQVGRHLASWQWLWLCKTHRSKRSLSVHLNLCTVSSLPRTSNSSQNLSVMPAWGPNIPTYCPPTPVVFQQHIGTEVPVLLTYKWPSLAAIRGQNPLPPHED